MFAKAAVVLAGLGVFVVAQPGNPSVQIQSAPTTVATVPTTLPPVVIQAPAPVAVKAPKIPPTQATLPPPPVSTTLKPLYGPGSYLVGSGIQPGTYVVTSVCTFELPAESTPNRGTYPWATTYSNVGRGATITIPQEAIGLSVVAWAGCEFS